MRKILVLFALVASFSAVALAESWTGKLVDSACIAQQKSAACDPTAATTKFALSVSGQVYNLDDAGNAKAFEAVKNRADRAADPAKPASTAITAKVTGSKEGNDMIKVESIEVQ